jgi:hypothetical protein
MAMGWQTITVGDSVGEALAAQLLAAASEPATWSLENLGATVIRLKAGKQERFYFSPRAAVVLASVVAAHGGKPCNPPLSRALVPAQTARLLLGFQSRWEEFRPPRLVSQPQGIPITPRRNES